MPKSSPPTAASIRSFVRNNLLASPDFSRLYTGVLVSEGYNPKQAKDLAEQYQKKFGVNMPTRSKTKICTHIKVSGVRCGSPALRGEQFCYFHQRMIRTVKSPHSRLHHVALLENEQAIQASLMEVVNALVRGTIDLKRGELILRALNAAVRNSRRAHFNLESDEMVTQLPDFESEHEPINVTAGNQYAAALAAQVPPANQPQSIANVPSNRIEPEQPPKAKELALPKKQNTESNSPAEIKEAASAKEQKIERKPPLGVKEPAAPKEEKIAAHGASRGTGENQMEQAPQGAKENPLSLKSKSPPLRLRSGRALSAKNELRMGTR